MQMTDDKLSKFTRSISIENTSYQWCLKALTLNHRGGCGKCTKVVCFDDNEFGIYRAWGC